MEIIKIEINNPEEIKELLVERVPFQHPDLAVVCLGGSKSSDSGGPLSDIDITTVMKPEKVDKVATEAIETLSGQIRRFVFSVAAGSDFTPVVISTIRLEEAQISLAEVLNPGKIVIPVHWLHYPSLEFATINEPPDLLVDLLDGKFVVGKRQDVINHLVGVNKLSFSNLAGLDWLTDSFRAFLANRNEGEFPVAVQPDSFLKRLATHNLEYFWKWKIIRRLIERKAGETPKDWKEMEQITSVIPKEIWETALHVRKLRHQGAWAQTPEIIALHKETFNIWPI